MKTTEIEDLMPAELIIQVLDKMERRPRDEFEDFHKPGLPEEGVRAMDIGTVSRRWRMHRRD